jgi:antitoxin component YwqK of YwqJK toxin-antitoxin module
MPERINSADKNLKKEKGVYNYNGSEYSGILEEYDTKGQLLSEIKLVNGKKEGLSKFYWPDGKLKCEANYQNGIYHGSVIRYFENGNLFSSFNYKDGQESGKQQMWKSDGRIKVNYEVINGRKYGLTGVKNCVNVLEEDSHSY